MLTEKERADLLWQEIAAGRQFISVQLRWRYYLIGTTFATAFLLVLPLEVPRGLVAEIARHYGVSSVAVASPGLLGSLIWFCWSTAILQVCQRSLVVARETAYVRTLETRLAELAGPAVTRQQTFTQLNLRFLRLSDPAYYLTFSAVSLAVCAIRLVQEWRQLSGWDYVFAAADTVLLTGTVWLVQAAARDLMRLRT